MCDRKEKGDDGHGHGRSHQPLRVNERESIAGSANSSNSVNELEEREDSDLAQ